MMGEERSTAVFQALPSSDAERKLKASGILYMQDGNAAEVLLAT